MAINRNIFKDPAGVQPDFAWPFNHSEESEGGKTRNIAYGANTANTGFVRQQSDDRPIGFGFSGAILERSHLEQMIAWYALCDSQTIYFEDFAGDEYEVIISSFKPTRLRTIRNPRDLANAPYWYWRYEITLDVVRVISGPWTAVLT